MFLRALARARVCVRVSVRAHARAHMCVCARACARAHVVRTCSTSERMAMQHATGPARTCMHTRRTRPVRPTHATTIPYSWQHPECASLNAKQWQQAGFLGFCQGAWKQEAHIGRPPSSRQYVVPPRQYVKVMRYATDDAGVQLLASAACSQQQLASTQSHCLQPAVSINTESSLPVQACPRLWCLFSLCVPGLHAQHV